jgi:hypothetical protein
MKSNLIFKIWIFGDSFAGNATSRSWAHMLEAYGKVVIRSHNGSSEHRIWKTYQQNKRFIKPDDIVIFCHTSASRVYLKTGVESLTRQLLSHPFCDLIFGDVFAKKEQNFINILKTIWDDEYFEDTYNLLVTDLKRVPRSVHINFFDSGIYNTIWQANPGKINHMDDTGNLLVLQQIVRELP